MKLALCLTLVVACCHPGWGRPCTERREPVCSLLDCSECLAQCDVAIQYWKVHCIGDYALPGRILPWWVRGKLICPACIPWEYEESDTGAISRLEVEFKKVCATCAIRGRLPVGHTCEAGLVDVHRPIMTPEVVRLSTSHRESVQIEVCALDIDGDLMGISWTEPKFGQLIGGPWIVPLVARSLCFNLLYTPPACWVGEDSFVAWAYDAGGNTTSQLWLIEVSNQPPVASPLHGETTVTIAQGGAISGSPCGHEDNRFRSRRRSGGA